MNLKTLAGGAALTALSFGFGGPVWAQSTGSQAQEEEIVVTAAARRSIDGAILAESVPKSRSTITSEFIDQQAAGQTILQTVNLIPGVNFTNNDPYGSAGGNLRIRGFDGPRISLTFDGVPLNDTGNYAIFSNQQLDPELITRAAVNLGTTDVDSPTASATGGTVNYVTRTPTDDLGLTLQGSIGEHNYYRAFGVLDSGEIGPLNTTSFWAASYTNYDKWKGPGEIEKQQYNGRIYQGLGDGDFMSVAFHYNQNRNHFYRNISLTTFNTAPDTENDISCTRPTPVFNAGTTTDPGQNESNISAFVRSDGTTGTGSCTNYHNLRINPSNTGNIRGQASFGLTDNVRLTIDPSFQYVLANGGGFTVVSERDDRLDLADGNNGGPGVDLNDDGDVVDSISLFTPNNTNTRRYGFTSSVIWDLTDEHRVRLAYTLDYGRHRQTGEASFLDLNGNPADVFGGKDGHGPRIIGLDGSHLRGRDRFSIARLDQFAIEYRGQYFDDAITLAIGLRAPMFERELNQFCFSQDGSSTVRCTNETPVPFVPTSGPNAGIPNGNFQFASTGLLQTSPQFLPPYSAEPTYDDILPNVGVNWRLADPVSIYFSYAEGLSAPRTDNVYTVSRGATPTVIEFSLAQPETTKSYDLGLRVQTSNIIGSIALWRTDYENRIVSAFDDTLGFFVDRNLGAVEMQGVDAQVGIEPFEGFSLYASASYIDSEVQENIPLSATTFLPSAGKALVETPDWTFALRGDWDVTEFFSIGMQGKYVGDRFATDVNDEVSPSYTVWDLDARLALGFVNEDTYLQFNVINLFDEAYLGGISSTNNAITLVPIGGGPPRNGQAPLYALGAPRTAMVTLRTRF